MPKKTKRADDGTDEQVLAQLNRHPEIRERVLTILRLAESAEGTPQTADEIETQLLEAVRQLGRQTMGDWAHGQAQRVAQEIKAVQPRSYPSKKNG